MPIRSVQTVNILVVFLLLLGFFRPANAHEPIFGLGPRVIFKGGVGIETEIKGEEASGGGDTERTIDLNTEILYGLTENFAVTLAVPTILNREQTILNQNVSSSGLGDLSLRGKFRFWRHDSLGTQDSAALILGIKFPTGDDRETPKLGSGSTDFLFGLAAGHESRRWYFFGDARYRLNTEGEGDLKVGDRLFIDAAIGIRPWLTEYLKPDLVVMTEFNWETWMKNELKGQDISDSGGDRLFVTPGFFLTYRNVALKGGVQIPIYRDLRGDQPEEDYRFVSAVEFHF